MKRSELQLIERAVKKRWPISDAYRAGLVQKMMMIIAEGNDRTAISAGRVVAALEAQNQTDEIKVVDVELQARNSELDAIAADLGIAAHLIVDASGGSSEADLGSQTDSG